MLDQPDSNIAIVVLKETVNFIEQYVPVQAPLALAVNYFIVELKNMCLLQNCVVFEVGLRSKVGFSYL